jgi:hypothetical protein
MVWRCCKELLHVLVGPEKVSTVSFAIDTIGWVLPKGSEISTDRKRGRPKENGDSEITLTARYSRMAQVHGGRYD